MKITTNKVILIVLFLTFAVSGCSKKSQPDSSETVTQVSETQTGLTQTADAPNSDAIQQEKPDNTKTLCEAGNCPSGLTQTVDAPSSDATQQEKPDNTKTSCEAGNCPSGSTQTVDSSSSDAIRQEELDNLSITLCKAGNCPCGDGHCSKGSYCIKDKCICGANPDKGTFNKRSIVSNNYGEFDCIAYIDKHEDCDPEELFDLEECPEWDYYNDFICRKEGCKTGDGREYAKSKDNDISYNEYLNRPDLHVASKSEYEIDEFPSKYAKLVHEKYLDKKCGKFAQGIKIFERGDGGNYGDPPTNDDVSDFKCSLRRKCHGRGVTKEHLSEYVCDVGRQYYMNCPCAYNNIHKDVAFGLRCMKAEGCTCGSVHCPQYAFCDEGSCKYDLYYQHRVCPGPDWDPDMSDSENYVESVEGECSYGNIENRIDDLDETDSDYEAHKAFIYDDCYWDLYDAQEMTLNDPCVPK